MQGSYQQTLFSSCVTCHSRCLQVQDKCLTCESQSWICVSDGYCCNGVSMSTQACMDMHTCIGELEDSSHNTVFVTWMFSACNCTLLFFFFLALFYGCVYPVTQGVYRLSLATPSVSQNINTQLLLMFF